MLSFFEASFFQTVGVLTEHCDRIGFIPDDDAHGLIAWIVVVHVVVIADDPT